MVQNELRIPNGYILKLSDQSLGLEQEKIIEYIISFIKEMWNDLIKDAYKNSNTKDEYHSYMLGIGLFWKILTKEKLNVPDSPTIKTLDDAISYLDDLMPFITPEEKENHLKLRGYLYELKIIEDNKNKKS